ncbi:MAG: response regulator [Pseudanabaena sp. ELA607]|jgi:CheY-like chemotaxis protein
MAKILLVEDNELNLDMLRRRLERKGFTIISASNGNTAVELAESERPDLIIMDMSLPEVDGWTATQMIKSNPKLHHIPIIGCSAHAMPGDRDRAIAAGCNDYDFKPIQFDRLMELIQQLLPVIGH